jgi:hypothetical protein
MVIPDATLLSINMKRFDIFWIDVMGNEKTSPEIFGKFHNLVTRQ